MWLERAAGEHPLDSVLMDRLRHTVRVAAAAGPRMGDPALLEVVLSGEERREDRVRAVGCWGWTPAVAESAGGREVERCSPMVGPTGLHADWIG